MKTPLSSSVIRMFFQWKEHHCTGFYLTFLHSAHLLRIYNVRSTNNTAKELSNTVYLFSLLNWTLGSMEGWQDFVLGLNWIFF